MNFTIDTPDATPEPLPRADWHHHPVAQRNVRRFGAAWVDSAMLACYGNPSDVGRSALILREGHVITDGARRATLYAPPGVVPSDEQCVMVANAAGIATDVAKPFEPADAGRRPEDEFKPLRGGEWLSDRIVAYAGEFTSECGHHTQYFLPHESFPRCEPCGRSVRWRRL